MKKYILSFILCLISSTCFAQIGISTGSPSGTYYQFGQDIKTMCSSDSFTINILESQGSLSNILRVFADKRTQYAIVQNDALLYQEMKDPGQISKIKMIFPFYNEEIHILVRKDANITTIHDLNNKNVSIGKEGSGNWVTGNIIKAKLNIKWNDVNYDPKTSLDALMMGDIDAMIYVAGKPIAMLEQLPESAASKIALLPIVNVPELEKYYTQSIIPEGLYPWQKNNVKTYAVTAILITFDYASQKRQDEIQKLTSCIINKLPDLQSEYHTKWREVNPMNYQKVKWETHKAVTQILSKGKK